MTELDRLGKPGAYRLGRLRAQGVGGLTSPPPLRPSFARQRHRGALSLWIAGWLAGAAVLAAGAAAGWWFLPYLAGLAAGFAAGAGRWRPRPMLAAAAAMAVTGWAVPLCWLALHGRVGTAQAGAAAAAAGLPAQPLAGVAVTLLAAAGQALAGAWLGWTLLPRRRDLI